MAARVSVGTLVRTTGLSASDDDMTDLKKTIAGTSNTSRSLPDDTKIPRCGAAPMRHSDSSSQLRAAAGTFADPPPRQQCADHQHRRFDDRRPTSEWNVASRRDPGV